MNKLQVLLSGAFIVQLVLFSSLSTVEVSQSASTTAKIVSDVGRECVPSSVLETHSVSARVKHYGHTTPNMVQKRYVTNSQGFRDENYNKSKPPNTTRIILVGDSFTHGYGLERSDRYGDIVERKLNESLENRVQVLNIAKPGWGMPDYYKAIKQMGLEYNPDLIVVGFTAEDELQEKKKEAIKSEIKADYTSQNQNKLIRDSYQKFIESAHKNNSCILDSKRKIERLSEKEALDVVFYLLMPVDEEMKKLDMENSSNVVKAGLVGGKRLRFADGHYNIKGNRMLAKNLKQPLKNRIS